INTFQQFDSTQAVAKVLRSLTAHTAQNLKMKAQKRGHLATSKKAVSLDNFLISEPDFARYTRQTSISGEVSGGMRQPPTLVINTNPLLREETNFSIPTGQTGSSFHFNVPLKASTTATLKMGKQSIDLYLQPGSDLTLNLAGNDLYYNLSFSGKGSGINNYLVATAAAFREHESELEAKIRHAQPIAFKRYLTELKNEKLQFLRSYLQSHVLTAEVIKYARADINYWYAFNLMNYPFEHPIAHNQPAPMAVPDTYYDFLEAITANNVGALPNKYYIYYLQDYLSFNANRAENKGKSRYALADKYLRGKPLYFYKALQHSVDLKRYKGRTAEWEAYQFIHNSPYKLYGEFVKQAYHESRGIAAGMNAPNFELVDSKGNIVSLEDYRGKVVFLDFWATWCRPCTRQIPAHQRLQAQFDQDNVVFLYVSLDRNADNWRSYLSKGTFPGKHLFATEEMSTKYKVETLPYSLIIDPYGKIVWQHTGGFSVDKTSKRILELLQ
ncbi:MAG: redoxin domain-containing protein, partial [Bacteroidota bacterium]